MKTQWMYFALIWLLVALAGCGDDSAVEQALRDAESCMMQRPDSALMLLTDIDCSAIYDDELRARHALLLSQAKDKNYIDETSDSLINIAVEHYNSADDPMRRFLSLYYQGRVYYNANNFTRSILSYTQAEQLIDQFDNPHAVGLLYAQLGLIYNNFFDLPKGLDAYEKAYYYYEKADEEIYQYHAQVDIARSLVNLKRYNEAEIKLLEVLEWSYDNQTYWLCQNCVELLIIAYQATDDFHKLNQLVNSKFFAICNRTIFILGCEAVQNAERGDKFEANKCLDSIKQLIKRPLDFVDLYLTSYRVHKILGDYKKALTNHERVLELQDSVMRNTMQRPLVTAQRDYFKYDAQIREYELRQTRYFIVIFLIIVVVVFAFAYLYYRHCIILKEAKINTYISDVRNLQYELTKKDTVINDMSEQIASKNSKIDEFSGKVIRLFAKQFEMLDDLTNIYYESEGSAKSKDKIYRQVKAEIESFGNDGYPQLENIVNTYKENVMALLRSEIDLKEDDYRLLCYCFAGFSRKSISVFMGSSITNVSTRKWRLKSEIAKHNPPNCTLFMQYLG